MLQDGPRNMLQDGPRNMLQDGPRNMLQDGPRNMLQNGPGVMLQDGPKILLVSPCFHLSTVAEVNTSCADISFNVNCATALFMLHMYWPNSHTCLTL